MPRSRARPATLVLWGWFTLGCGSAPAPTESALPCSIQPRDSAERVILLSEAHAARDAGQRTSAEFSLVVPGEKPVELQLASVGCNCYQVQRDGQTLRVGNRFVIPAGGATRLQIVSQPSVESGVRQYHAELAGTRSDGSPFTMPLAHAVRTVADIAIRPDVIQIDPAPQSRGAGAPVSVLIEQHFRAADADDVTAAWDVLPHGLAATAPVAMAPPQEICTGVWWVRWRSDVTARLQDGGLPESPLVLPVVSRLGEREIARTQCTLIVRRRRGIAAPPVVHFGRMEVAQTSVRRIQIRALDGVPFSISAITAREGGVEAEFVRNASHTEHWVEVRARGLVGHLDDVLTVETDHPDGASLEIPVKGIGVTAAAD